MALTDRITFRGTGVHDIGSVGPRTWETCTVR